MTAAGFRVEICTDAEEAWLLGDTEDYDLVVLDIGLPKLDDLLDARATDLSQAQMRAGDLAHRLKTQLRP